MSKLLISNVFTSSKISCNVNNGPLARYAKLRVAHAPGMPGTFSPPLRVSDPDMHHGTCVTHVPWCMPWSLTSSFLWNQWRGKRSQHSRRMRHPQFYVSGKRPIALVLCSCVTENNHYLCTHWISIHNRFTVYNGIIGNNINLGLCGNCFSAIVHIPQSKYAFEKWYQNAFCRNNDTLIARWYGSTF